MLAGKQKKKSDEFDAIIVGIIATFAFYGLIWLVFFIFLKNPYHRFFILLGGKWPEGIIQLSTYFCFFWAINMLSSKERKLNWETKAFELQLLPEQEHKVLLPDEINNLRLKLFDITNWDESLLVKTLKMASTKFRANKSVPETLDVVKMQSDINLNNLDTSYSIIKYLAWSIPSIGFIGTVIGISGALGQIDKAAAGDMSAVTVILGTAFDTTLVALLVSIFLMYKIHKTQQSEELFILSVQEYILENFINRIYVPKNER
jgi:biopolymer transport protein ExbB/TolQ